MPQSEDALKKALKAFKKRLKLTQLEEDSRLGHSSLTRQVGLYIEHYPH